MRQSLTIRAVLLSLLFSISAISALAQSRPNIVLIFVDDMGINDIGAYAYPEGSPYPTSGPIPIDNSNAGGSSRMPLPDPNLAVGLTPNIDSLASSGMKFTSFYAASPVCTPSRAGLMTGSYATRVRLESVILHNSNVWGLHSEEVTLPERLKQRGYATGMFGKWHLGDSIDFRPTRHGFDTFFGLATSHDLWPWHPNPTFAATIPDLPVYDGEDELAGSYTTATGGSVSSPLNKSTKTASYTNSSYLLEAMTEKTIGFMQSAHAIGEPFFVYFSAHAPHTPCIPHPDFDGGSGVSAYYDVMMELDFRVGQILDKLDTLGIANDTIVLFTSDNGPFVTRPEPTWPEQAVGSAYPFRGYKRISYEGGPRVPLLVRYPGQVVAGSVEDGLASNIDLMPTLLSLAGGETPTDRTLDGVDLWPLMNGTTGTSPRTEFFYYEENDTDAVGVRQGDWKQRFSALYNLSTDIQEQTDVAGSNSTIASSLSSAISSHNSSMSRRSRGLPQSNQIEIRKSAADPDNSNTVAIDEGSTATFEVRLASAANATVSISRFAGDTDLSVQSGASLSFTTGNYNVWQTVTLAAAFDADGDDDGATFRAASGSLHVREIFVNETDTQDTVGGVLSLSAATYSAAEADGTITITVSRSGGSTGAVSVDYATADGTATAGSDYTAATGTLNWTDGDAADKTFDVTIANDNDLEPDENFGVTLNSVSGGAGLDTSSATVTILDDDAPGSIQFSAATYSAGEGDGSATITATRTEGSKGAIAISYATADGTATAGSDYTAASGSLNWVDGDTADKTFSITLADDGDEEGSETILLTLSSPTGGASLGSPDSAELTLADNDSSLLYYESFDYTLASTLAANGWTVFSSSTTSETGTIGNGLTFGSGNVLETTGGAAEMSVTSGGSNFRNAGWQSPDFGGSFATVDSGAVWRSQLFRPTSANAAGSGSNESVDTNIVRYDVATTGEGNPNRIPGSTDNDTQERKFTLNGKNFNGAGALAAWAHNEGSTDGTSALSQNNTYLLISKYDFATKGVTVWVFDEATGQAVIDARASGPISESTLDGAVAAGFKDSVSTGTETVTLTPDDSIAINFGFNNNDSTTTATLDEFRVGISLDDVLPVNAAASPTGTLALSSSTYSVGEGDGTVTITVSRTSGSAGAASVDYATGDISDTATAGSDYTTASGSLNWADGDNADKTFDVTISDDGDSESSETFTVTLSSAVTVSLGSPASATVTITDNDASGPAAISGLVGWYDAQDLSGLDGISVTTWADKTGGSNSTADDLTQVTTGVSGTAIAPTVQTVALNGFDFRALRFVSGNTDEYEQLRVNNLVSSSNTTRTIVAVYKGGIDNANSRPVGFGSRLLDASLSKELWNLATDGNYGSARFDGAAIGPYTASGLTRDEFLLRTAVMESKTSFDEFIDELDANFTDTQVVSNGTPSNALSTILGSFHVGDVHNTAIGGGNGAADFDILEILVYERVLTTQERQDVQTYLQTKYTTDPNPSAGPPDAPSSLSASAVSGTQIDLAWTDNSSNETGFKVQRSATSGSGFNTFTTTAADATSFSDTGLDAGTTYFYQIIATNGSGDSAASNEASATTWTPAQSWRDQYFDQTDNSGDADDEVDFDKDGLKNLLERAFGTIPTDSSSFATTTPSTVEVATDSYLALTYRRLVGGTGTTGVDYTADGMTYTIEYDVDLTDPWSTGGISPVGVPSINGDGTESVTVRLNTTIPDADTQFMRLKVTPAP